jgi:phosphatidylserine/phosphatidylglycerophosphate/cardiolipin synthase-like enzyme
MEKHQQVQKYSSATFFLNNGIPAKIDDKHAIAHDKIIINDRETVIARSFNFTKAAEKSNAENLLVIRG